MKQKKKIEFFKIQDQKVTMKPNEVFSFATIKKILSTTDSHLMIVKWEDTNLIVANIHNDITPYESIRDNFDSFLNITNSFKNKKK